MGVLVEDLVDPAGFRRHDERQAEDVPELDVVEGDHLVGEQPLRPGDADAHGVGDVVQAGLVLER